MIQVLIKAEELTHLGEFLQKLFLQIDQFSLALGLAVIVLQVGHCRPPQEIAIGLLLGVDDVVGNVGHVPVDVVLFVGPLATEEPHLGGGDVMTN